MVDRQDETDRAAIRTLREDELGLVSGGWVQVVKGPDGEPGCGVVHLGPPPRLFA